MTEKEAKHSSIVTTVSRATIWVSARLLVLLTLFYFSCINISKRFDSNVIKFCIVLSLSPPNMFLSFSLVCFWFKWPELITLFNINMRLWPNENKRAAHGSVTRAPPSKVTQEHPSILTHSASRNVTIDIRSLNCIMNAIFSRRF